VADCVGEIFDKSTALDPERERKLLLLSKWECSEVIIEVEGCSTQRESMMIVLEVEIEQSLHNLLQSVFECGLPEIKAFLTQL
jgi:hypothetical protein